MVDGQLTRRKVLMSIGAAGVGTGVLSSTRVSALSRDRARQRDRRIHQRSHEILRRTNNPEKQREFLRNHGFNITSVQNTYSIPKPDESNGVEPRSIDEWDLEIHISLSKGSVDYAAELLFEYEADGGEGGEHPWDVAALGWETDKWEFAAQGSSTYSTGPTTIWYREPTSGSSYDGPDFLVDDNSLGEGNSGYYVCGAYINPIGPNYSPKQRKVSGGFTHTWNSVDITGFSVGYWGVMINVSNNTDKWSTRFDRNNQRLRVNQNDAV